MRARAIAAVAIFLIVGTLIARPQQAEAALPTGDTHTCPPLQPHYVDGSIVHRDRNDATVPVDRFYVRLEDELDAEPDTVIFEALTGTDGTFRLCFGDGDLQTNPDIFSIVVFAAYADDPVSPVSPPTLQVLEDGAPDDPMADSNYSTGWSMQLDQGAWVLVPNPVDIVEESPEETGFRIKDDLQRGYDFLGGATGPIESEWPEQVPLTPRSFFCYDPPFGLFCEEPRIYYTETAGEGRPNVVLHEMGHHVMYNRYGGDMPAESIKYFNGVCSGHRIGVDLDPDNRDCIWQEDFANFFVLAVNGSPILGSNDLENPNPLWPPGDHTEGRVAAALWDIHDSASDGTDAVSLGFDPIWDVIVPPFDEKFSDFWASWKSAGKDQCAVTAIHQNVFPDPDPNPYAADAWLSCADAQVGFQKVGASGGAVSGAEDPGGAGVITGLIDSFEFDLDTVTAPDIINVSGDVYAVAYEFDAFFVKVATLTIDGAGQIGAIIDTLQFGSSQIARPKISHITGDVYGIVHRGGPGLELTTVEITDAGALTSIDTLTVDPDNSEEPSLIPVSGDIYATVYQVSSVSGFRLTTVDIDPSGTPLSVVETVLHPAWPFSAITIVNVSGAVYAMAYNKPSLELAVVTRTIAADGMIGPVIADTTVDPQSLSSQFIFPVAGDVYGIVHSDLSDNGRLVTIDKDPTGTPITVVDTLQYALGADLSKAVAIGGTLFAVVYQDADKDGFISTLTIPASGTPLSLIDTFEFDTDRGKSPTPVLIANGMGGPGTVVGIAYSGPDIDGFLVTIGIGSSGFARVPLALMDLVDFTAQSVEATDGIALFDSKVTYDPAGIQVLRVGYDEGFQEGLPPPIIDNDTGTAQFVGLNLPAGPNPPLAHGFVYPRLIGAAAQPYTLQWESAEQPAVPYAYHWTLVGAEVQNTEQITFRRGDLNADGLIDTPDVTIIKRAIVGTDPPCDDLANPVSGCVNPAEAASIKWDDCAVGDRINVYDAIVLQQMLDGTISQLPSTCGGLQGSGPPATVTIATTTVPVSGSVLVPITVSDIADLNGLGGYEVLVEFDNAVVRVTFVYGGEAPFDGTPTANIDNFAGTVRITFAIGDSLGPTGTVEITNVRFKAAASPGTTTLDLTVRNLANTVPEEIPSAAVDGMVVVQ